MKTALISTYNKEGIPEFAKELVSLGWEIVASGGTANHLAEAGVPARDVAELVGGGEILGHRVVTLSREIHAGLLATDSKEDTDELERLGVPRIDLVCVDLYPLEETIKNVGLTMSYMEDGEKDGEVIEKTDIGGPALLRSAAKGRRIVVCDPADRERVLLWLRAEKPREHKVLRRLAAKAEAIVSKYCMASARYHSDGVLDGFSAIQIRPVSYGENPWQEQAVLLNGGSNDPLALSKFHLVSEAPASYNNLCDLDRLLQTITHIAAGFDENRGNVPLIAVGGKHGNACGAAVGDDPIDVLEKMIEGDTRAIFGGFVITNFHIGEREAKTLIAHYMPGGNRRLLDGVAAPSFSDNALLILKRKGGKCRLFSNQALGNLSSNSLDASSRFRYVRAGFLRQENYTFVLDMKNTHLEKIGEVNPNQEGDILLAWAVGATSNSNTVTLVRDGQLIGNGVGQQDRVGACELAIKRAGDAGHSLSGAVAYSDSFFPFVDGPKVLAEAGVRAILASSGSVRDEEIKQFCKRRELTLYLIPDRVGRGFFGH